MLEADNAGTCFLVAAAVLLAFVLGMGWIARWTGWDDEPKGKHNDEHDSK